MDSKISDFPKDAAKALSVSTIATAAELATDEWDNDFNCNYSHDGTKLLDAENFPDTVKVRQGTRIICDGVFSFQDYMDEDRPLGSTIPEDERVSFLDKIYLPDSVEHIGFGAFKECGWIRRIGLPSSLLTIRDEAFYGCWELRQIGFPAKLLSVGDRAFFECFSLEKVRINNGLQCLGSEAFAFCESLQEITLPSGLSMIGDDVFLGCKSLKRIFVPEAYFEAYKELLPAKMHRKLRRIGQKS